MDIELNDIENQKIKYFNSVFIQFENRLFLFALKITKSDATARDIVQEVFLKFWEQKDAFKQIEDIEAYLFRATKNKAIDFLRFLANDDKLRQNYFVNFTLVEDVTDKEVNQREFNRLLGTAIEKLPAQRSLIYQLSQVEGFSRREIAERMNISESTVKNQLTSALSSIRNFLKKNVKSLFSFF